MEKVHSASYQSELKNKFLIFSTLVLSNYDLFVKQGAASPRIAIKQTRDLLNSRGEDLTCSMVELIVRDSGRLSKKMQKGKSAPTDLPSTASPSISSGKEVVKCKIPQS